MLELAANDFAGVINVAGAEALTRYDLGCLIARAHQLDATKLAGATVTTLSTPTVAECTPGFPSLARSLLKTPLRGIREWLAIAP